MMRTVRLLGLDFADDDLASTARWLAARPARSAFDYVVTPNADHVVRLARNPMLWPIYEDALLRLMDSRVVARAARGLGLKAPPVVTGSDLTERLLRHHVRPHERVTIIGVHPSHLPALMARCDLAAPAHFYPPMGFERDPTALRMAVHFVLDHPSRFVFLALGSPKQEILAAAIKASGRATGIGLCVGASLDFLSGAAQRAPVWVQHAGLEWAHRLAMNPQRLARRYLVDNPPVFTMLMRERVRRWLAARDGAAADGSRSLGLGS